MTFAIEAEKSASERFMLVRLTPRKFLGVGTSIGGGQYTFSVASTINISVVTVNEVTEAVWTHVGSVLTVTSATNLTVSTNIVTIDHDIYLTGSKVRTTSGISDVPDADWEPLITEYPQFSQSMRNITDGVLSLSNTEISLISTDRWGQSLLGEDDSLSKAPVTSWACIDTESNNRRIFDGEVTSVRYSYGRISLSVASSLSKLITSATFGTRSQSQIFTGNSSGITEYPNPADENYIKPLTIGKSSPMQISAGWRHKDPYGVPNSATYHLSEGQKAIKISPQNPDGNDNIIFFLGRAVSSDVKKLNFGTISAAYAQYVERQVQENDADPGGVITIFDKIIYLQCSTYNCEIGDYIPTVEGWVCGYGSGLWGSYNVAICCPTYGPSFNDNHNIGNPSGAIAVPGIPNNTIRSMSMWIDGGDETKYTPYYYPLALTPSMTQRSQTTRYLKFTETLSSGPTIGGQATVYIYATVNPNTNKLISDEGVNQLSSATVNCRFSPATSLSHAEALKFVLKSSGLSVNTASFTQADTDLSANVSLTLPENGNKTFGTCLEIAQKIASSTLSMLVSNESNEIEYHVIENPTGATTDGTRDSINMLTGDTSTTVEYQDVHGVVNFENPQLKSVAEVGGAGASSSVTSTKNAQLHRVNKVKTFNHCLDNIQNRKAAIAGYFSSPTVEYSLATSSIDLASNIGDVIEITNSAVADSTEVVKGMITQLDQRGAKTNVLINEIRGVP